MYTVYSSWWFGNHPCMKSYQNGFQQADFFPRNLSQKTTYRNHQVALGFTSHWCHQSNAWKRSPKSTPKMRKFCLIKNSCLPSWKHRTKVCGVGFQLPVISVDAWILKSLAIWIRYNNHQQSLPLAMKPSSSANHFLLTPKTPKTSFCRRPPSRQRPGRSWDRARSSKTKIPGNKNLIRKRKTANHCPQKT